MKLAILYSGGKDSNFALLEVLKNSNNKIVCLIYMKSENPNSYMFQNVGWELVQMQSSALGIPLLTQKTKGIKEKELDDLKTAIKKACDEFEAEGIVSGAINSCYQASRIQKICNDLNLISFNPLWQINEDEFISKILQNNFDVKIFGVFSYPFDENLIGKKLDKKLVSKLKATRENYKISIAGEGGEFESFVLDSPLFKKKIKIDSFDVKKDSQNCAIISNISARLISK